MANDARAQITVERVTKLEERLDAIERSIAWIMAVLAQQEQRAVLDRPLGAVPDCGCGSNKLCNNVACPRRVVVSFTGVPSGVGFPE